MKLCCNEVLGDGGLAAAVAPAGPGSARHGLAAHALPGLAGALATLARPASPRRRRCPHLDLQQPPRGAEPNLCPGCGSPCHNKKIVKSRGIRRESCVGRTLAF